MKKIAIFLGLIAILISFLSDKTFAKNKFPSEQLIFFEVTVNVTLSTGLSPIGVIVTLNGIHDTVTSPYGTIVFDSVTPGPGEITAFKIGYDMYESGPVFINSDMVFNILLSEKRYPPTCLEVDPLTLKATWCEPLRTALDEDFENPTFPPAGWQALSESIGWQRTDDGSSGGWTIPPRDSFYAMTNDDAAGGIGYGCCDYLITPSVDMRESEDYTLTFDSFYNGDYGQLAYVKYSLDGGTTWEVLSQLTPAIEWMEIELDLGGFCGPDGPAQIMFAFHADDAGGWASGWAIDNVKIQVPAPSANYLDFRVFLDDSLVGVTTETNWNYAPLIYGQTFTASVAARYSSGLSSKDYDTISCTYLFPPDSLTGYAPDDAVILDWTPPLEPWWVNLSGMSYQEYLRENNLQNIRSNDAPSAGRAPRANISIPGVNPFDGIRDLNSKAWACDALAVNMVTFTLGTPGTLNYLAPSAGDFISAADIVDGVYYGTINGGTFVTMDTATGAITTIGSTADLTGLAYDHTTSTMYGVDFGGTLYTIDLETGAATIVGNTGGVLIDCACDNDGILFAVDIGSDLFGYIDKVTAAWTTISNLPFDANYAQGMGCDHNENVVYHAAYNNSLEAGQLYYVNQAIGTYTLIGNFQDNTQVDGMAMPGEVHPFGHLPENLLGYNIYRNGAFVAYKPHEPPGEYVHQGYIDEDLWPVNYEYTVTAVYDLAPYGFPGETGESMPEGPAEVIGVSPFGLDFLENWSMGTFDDNLWMADSANWLVNTQVGNPSPAAEFSGDPVITNFQASLTSYPLTAVGMTQGKIWLDFDLKLDAAEPTGEELIQAEIWNSATSVWNTVAVYSNDSGSFDWTSEHIDIMTYAMNQIFQVRFRAIGSNSASILGWFIDNIHIYRACDGPINLTTDAVADQGIYINWEMPGYGSLDEWINRDEEVYSGLASGSKSNLVTGNKVCNTSMGSRAIGGFNIYRSLNGSGFVLIEFNTEGPPILVPHDNLIPGMMFCYMVTAVWTSETDVCESAFSNESCVLWTGIKDNEMTINNFNLYPNPADNHVYIYSSDELESITIFDAMGRLIKEEIAQGNEYVLSTASFDIGVYLLRIESEAGITTRTLTIQR